MLVNGLIAIALGYLYGSFPISYLIVYTFRGRDILKTGDGTPRTSNVFREVGLGTAAVVALLNTGKGAVASLAVFSFMPLTAESPLPVWQLAALLAVVVGHLWPVFLKFRGGYGLAVSIGILALVLPQAMLIALAITILLVMFFRNPVLAVNIGLLSVPVTAVFQPENIFLILFPQARPLLVAFPVVLLLMLGLNFLPTARKALAEAGSKQALIAELLRADSRKAATKKKKKGR